MAGAPEVTAVYTARAEISRYFWDIKKGNKVTTFANKIPCGHILNIQAAMAGKKQSLSRKHLCRSPFQASLIFMHKIMTYLRMMK